MRRFLVCLAMAIVGGASWYTLPGQEPKDEPHRAEGSKPATEQEQGKDGEAEEQKQAVFAESGYAGRYVSTTSPFENDRAFCSVRSIFLTFLNSGLPAPRINGTTTS